MQVKSRLNKIDEYIKAKDNQDIPLKAVNKFLNIMQLMVKNDNQDISDDEIINQELSKINNPILLKRVCKYCRVDYQEFKGWLDVKKRQHIK